MVNKVAKQLKKQPSNAGKVDNILKKQVEDKTERINKVLEELRSIWMAKQNPEAEPVKKDLPLI
jgi:hypothetical protein